MLSGYSSSPYLFYSKLSYIISLFTLISMYLQQHHIITMKRHFTLANPWWNWEPIHHHLVPLASATQTLQINERCNAVEDEDNRYNGSENQKRLLLRLERPGQLLLVRVWWGCWDREGNFEKEMDRLGRWNWVHGGLLTKSPILNSAAKNGTYKVTPNLPCL